MLVMLGAPMHSQGHPLSHFLGKFWFYQSGGGQEVTGYGTGAIQDPDQETIKDQDTFDLIDFEGLETDVFPANTYKLKLSSPKSNPDANIPLQLEQSILSLSPMSQVLAQETSSTTEIPALSLTTESSTLLSKLLSIFQ